MFSPMALAVRMRCLQYSLGIRWGCISAPRIWNGLPFSMNSWLSSPPNLKTAYRATFRDETLTQIFDYLSASADIRWRVVKRNVSHVRDQRTGH